MRYIERCEKRLDGKLGFSKEEIAEGKLHKFIDILMEMDCEIHIWTDSCTWTVEYLRDTTSNEGINFQVIDYDQDCIVDSQYINWEELEKSERK